VEDKKYPPPLGTPVYKGVSEDLVEVEVIFEKKYFVLVDLFVNRQALPDTLSPIKYENRP